MTDKVEMLTREQVREQLGQLQSGQIRRIDHGPQTRVMVADQTVLRPGGGQRLLTLDDEGTRSLIDYSGMPLSCARALSPDTFGRAMTELLARKRQYSVTVRDNNVVGFANPAAGEAQMPVERTLSTLEKAVKGLEYFRVVIMDRTSAMVETVGERQQPVVRGDLVRAGVMVRFSPIGAIRPVVQAYALRLSCTNGATATSVIREYQFTGHRGGGEGDGTWQWYRQSIRAAYNSFSQVINEYRKMTKEKIEPKDRAMVLEGLLKQAGIPEEQRQIVRAWALEEPPRTAYDVFNLVTRASSHLLEKPAHIEKALVAVSQFSDEANHARCCPVCNRTR